MSRLAHGSFARHHDGGRAAEILELLTIDGFGIWRLVGMIVILTGSFRNGDGRKITEWT